jgi:hypothetical protein
MSKYNEGFRNGFYMGVVVALSVILLAVMVTIK